MFVFVVVYPMTMTMTVPMTMMTRHDIIHDDFLMLSSFLLFVEQVMEKMIMILPYHIVKSSIYSVVTTMMTLYSLSLS